MRDLDKLGFSINQGPDEPFEQAGLLRSILGEMGHRFETLPPGAEVMAVDVRDVQSLVSLAVRALQEIEDRVPKSDVKTVPDANALLDEHGVVPEFRVTAEADRRAVVAASAGVREMMDGYPGPLPSWAKGLHDVAESLDVEAQ